MKFQFEVDLEALDGHAQHVAYLLFQIAHTLMAGAWGDDIRNAHAAPKCAEIKGEHHNIIARAAVFDETFDGDTKIDKPCAVAPLNDPLNVTPAPETTLQ